MEKLIALLSKLGLTSKQAKVYTALLQSDPEMDANHISKITNIHPQDVYKILKILQKKGLVAANLGKPITFTTFPVEVALNNFLEAKKEELIKKNEELKNVVIDIGRTVNGRAVVSSPDCSDQNYIFQLAKDGKSSIAVLNKASISMFNTKIQLDMLFECESLFRFTIRDLEPWQAQWKILSKNKVNTRILVNIINQNHIELLKQYEKTLHKNLSYEIRTCENLPFYMNCIIFDSKELWINLDSDCTLEVTNSKSMVGMANIMFDQLWKRSEVFTINKPTIEKNA